MYHYTNGTLKIRDVYSLDVYAESLFVKKMSPNKLRKKNSSLLSNQKLEMLELKHIEYFQLNRKQFNFFHPKKNVRFFFEIDFTSINLLLDWRQRAWNNNKNYIRKLTSI